MKTIFLTIIFALLLVGCGGQQTKKANIEAADTKTATLTETTTELATTRESLKIVEEVAEKPESQPILAKVQEHLSFNGATFGQELNAFDDSLNNSNKHSERKYIEHTHKDLYDRYFVNCGRVNTYNCQYYIHCSRKTKIVFETIAWFEVSNLKEELKFFVKLFEEKYGDHIEEDKNNLGYITLFDISFINRGPGEIDEEYYAELWHSTAILGIKKRKKEMFAFKYTVYRKNDNKAIGEIRLSCAPDNIPTNENDSGLIEITYRDYKAADMAVNEYKNLMNSIF